MEEAQKLYKAILQSEPNNLQAQKGLAYLNTTEQPDASDGPPQEALDQLINLYNQGQLAVVVEQANTIKEQYPGSFVVWNVLGAANKRLGRVQAASEAFKKALSLKPDYADAYNNLGVILKDQGELEEAISSYNKALSLKPDYAEAYNNLGNALQDQGKLEEAIEAYKKALWLKSEYAAAHNNIGKVLKEKSQLDEAIASYKKAISLNPDFAEANYNCSVCYNLKGELRKGLELAEWRMKKVEPPAHLPRTDFIWDGHTCLSGRSFFIYEEQGLGDVIQFCRYLPLLEQKGATVIFKVRKELNALLRTLRSNVVMNTTDPHETQIDFEAPLMSLPHLFKTQLDTIPSTNPYLYADHDRTKTWGERLRGDKFKIGICWQGSKAKIDLGRSFPLSLFEGLSNAPNVELISLHKGEGESQIDGISFEVTTLGAHFDAGDDAFLDTAAVMMNCDLIITSDTAVAHLAGALGCRTWVVLKHVPDWRWMLNRPDSPWYPTMTLYRQKISGDWGCVFDAINRDLHILLDQRGQ